MEEINRKGKKTDILIKWLMFTAAITGMAIITGFYPIYGNIPLTVIPCILVLLMAKPVFFERVKLSTLLVMRILIILAALRILNPQTYVNIIMIMLVVNILEAIFTDIFRYKKYLNAISGVAVAAGVFTLRGTWQFDAPIGDYYMANGAVVTITILYALAYTIWNWIFITHEFSSSVALMHVGFLLAPLVGSICTLELGAYGGIGMWLLLRANSLSVGGWMQIAAKDWFEREYYSEKFDKFVQWTKKRNVQIACMCINLILIAMCFVLMMQNGGFSYTLAPFMGK